MSRQASSTVDLLFAALGGQSRACASYPLAHLFAQSAPSPEQLMRIGEIFCAAFGDWMAAREPVVESDEVRARPISLEVCLGINGERRLAVSLRNFYLRRALWAARGTTSTEKLRTLLDLIQSDAWRFAAWRGGPPESASTAERYVFAALQAHPLPTSERQLRRVLHIFD